MANVGHAQIWILDDPQYITSRARGRFVALVCSCQNINHFPAMQKTTQLQFLKEQGPGPS